MSIVRAAAIALGVMLVAGTAHAADRALPELIGYSEDGRYFAFESYGTHDGSGAPFATITVLDLDAGAGTRLASFAENGGEDDVLAAIRAKVAGEAKATLAKYALTQPAQYVSMVGDGDASASGLALPFGQPGGGAMGEVYQASLLRLSSFATEDKTGCSDYDERGAAGLTLDVVTTDGRRQVFADGQTIRPGATARSTTGSTPW